jgi:hypothetical protein
MLLNEYTDKLVKVTFEVELNLPKWKKKYDYKELVTFLDQVEYLHEAALKIAYNELPKNSFRRRNLINENLVIDSFNLDDSLKFSISFFIDFDGLFPYYFALKAMIGVCKKYGKNTDELLKTLKRILLCIQQFIENSPSIKRRIGPKIKALIIDLQDNIYLKNLETLLNDPGFKRIYNSFCKTAITIKNIVSIFEFFEEKVSDKLIEDYNDL